MSDLHEKLAQRRAKAKENHLIMAMYAWGYDHKKKKLDSEYLTSRLLRLADMGESSAELLVLDDELDTEILWNEKLDQSERVPKGRSKQFFEALEKEGFRALHRRQR